MQNGGAAPDPSTQFSLFRLYIIEHPTFHSAQDDEMRCEGLKLAVFLYRKHKETLIKSQSQIIQEFLYIASS